MEDKNVFRAYVPHPNTGTGENAAAPLVSHHHEQHQQQQHQQGPSFERPQDTDKTYQFVPNYMADFQANSAQSTDQGYQQVATPVSMTSDQSDNGDVDQEDDDLIILDSTMVKMTDQDVRQNLNETRTLNKQGTAKQESAQAKNTLTKKNSLEKVPKATKATATATSTSKKSTGTGSVEKKRSSAELAESTKKKSKPNTLSEEDFENILVQFKLSFEQGQDLVDPFIGFIKEIVKRYKNNYDILSEKLTRIFFSIPENVYHGKLDCRYKGWKVALEAIGDKTFWKYPSVSVRKFFLRVRNWLSHDFKFKDYKSLEKGLALIVEVALPIESVQSYKMPDVLNKLKKLQDQPLILKLVDEIMGSESKPAAKAKSNEINGNKSSVIIKSMNTSKPIEKPKKISKSSIFINDPHKKKADEIDQSKNANKDIESTDEQQKAQKKVFSLSEYLNKSTTQKTPDASEREESSSEESKDEKMNASEENENGATKGILRRKTLEHATRQRRKLAARGVRFKDTDLVSVRLIHDSYDRSSNVKDVRAGKEGAAMLGMAEDESVEWSTPIDFNAPALEWYNAELFQDVPLFRGGDLEIESEDRDAQLERVRNIPEATYDLVSQIALSPHEPDTLRVLPPRMEEAVMVPFGSEGA